MYYINLRTNLKITKKLLFKFQKSILRTATILKKKKKKEIILKYNKKRIRLKLLIIIKNTIKTKLLQTKLIKRTKIFNKLIALFC